MITELRQTYVLWRDMKDCVGSTGECWEWFNVRFRTLFQDSSRMSVRERKRSLRGLQRQLQELHKLRIQGHDVGEDLEEPALSRRNQ